MISIVIVGIWSMVGYNMIVILAGLQEIPQTYYEAAEIDGAGPVKNFFNNIAIDNSYIVFYYNYDFYRMSSGF